MKILNHVYRLVDDITKPDPENPTPFLASAAFVAGGLATLYAASRTSQPEYRTLYALSGILLLGLQTREFLSQLNHGYHMTRNYLMRFHNRKEYE